MFVIQTWPELGNTRRTHKYTRNSQGNLNTKEGLIIIFFSDLHTTILDCFDTGGRQGKGNFYILVIQFSYKANLK